jgi:hypothetical protein
MGSQQGADADRGETNMTTTTTDQPAAHNYAIETRAPGGEWTRRDDLGPYTREAADALVRLYSRGEGRWEYRAVKA